MTSNPENQQQIDSNITSNTSQQISSIEPGTGSSQQVDSATDEIDQHGENQTTVCPLLYTIDGRIYDTKKEISEFWSRVKAKIDALDEVSLRETNRHQELPLARIKKIMKLDDDVRNQMISSDAPILLAKAAEIFIEEITLLSWYHTDEAKRKTLQKSDISLAMGRNEQFDFLIDIVPRDESRKLRWNYPSTEKPKSPVASTATTNLVDTGNMQFVVQSEGSALESGSVVQATPIGQPIQLPASSDGQPIQLIAVNLPDGNIQQFQVQLPPSSQQ